ncbi:hypothetical protein GW755_01560 [bacterium]|nr:hypothetical protein [bacterium]
MDLQLILQIVLLLLALNLLIVGVYVVIVIRDVRGMLKTANRFFDESHKAIKDFSGSLVSLPLIIKTGLEIYRNFSNVKKK